MQTTIMQEDENYLVTRAIMEDVLPRMETLIGSGPDALYARLGTAMQTYSRSSMLIAMHYSLAEPFHDTMPPDKMMGMMPYQLLYEKGVMRTSHPILSFGGVHADEILLTQTLFDPLAPIRELAEKDGWVVLLNVDHSVDTSIHYAEKLAGRGQFVRWAMTPGRILECPGFPGDSSGFNAIEEYVSSITRRVDMGDGAFIQAVPLKRLLDATVELIKIDPLALLCQRSDCERCNAVRVFQK
jgi:aminoglycoside 3-N-acetyltransferase